jgi:hypothetical protein
MLYIKIVISGVRTAPQSTHVHKGKARLSTGSRSVGEGEGVGPTDADLSPTREICY